jgi:calcium-dependent protein kinase
MVLAHRSTTEEIGYLRKAFKLFDKNKEGTLNYEEFKAALFQAGYLEEDYREIFDAVDIDGTGRIRYTEFLAATLEAAGWITEDRLAEAFDRVDHDDTG